MYVYVHIWTIYTLYMHICVCAYLYIYEISLNNIERLTRFQEEKTRHCPIRLPDRLVRTAGCRGRMPDWTVNALRRQPNGSLRSAGGDRPEVSHHSCFAQNRLDLHMTLVLQVCWAAAVRDMISHAWSVKQMLEAGHLLLFRDCKLKMCLKWGAA